MAEITERVAPMILVPGAAKALAVTTSAAKPVVLEPAAHAGDPQRCHRYLCRLTPSPGTITLLPGAVRVVEYLGPLVRIELDLAGFPASGSDDGAGSSRHDR